MNVVKCDKGHFYNGDRYKACPHCKEMQQLNVFTPVSNTGIPSMPKQSENTYMHSIQKQPENILPIGWLVGVSGLAFGKQYPLFACDNFIGSGADNTICVQEDAYVLPSHHCALSFNMQQSKIVLNMKASSGVVCVNDKKVLESCIVTHADRIQIGSSVYMLVELCREGFSWWKQVTLQPEEQKTAADVEIDDIDRAFAEEYQAAKRPDISGIRAQMQQKRMQEQSKSVQMEHQMLQEAKRSVREVAFSVQKTPVYSEISAKDAARVAQQQTNVLTTPLEFEDAEETNVLTTATWRCRMCNGQNSEFANVCKICGSPR